MSPASLTKDTTASRQKSRAHSPGHTNAMIATCGEAMMFIGRRYGSNVAFEKGVVDRSSSATPLRRGSSSDKLTCLGATASSKPSRAHATTKRCAKPCSARTATKLKSRLAGRMDGVRGFEPPAQASRTCGPQTKIDKTDKAFFFLLQAALVGRVSALLGGVTLRFPRQIVRACALPLRLNPLPLIGTSA